MYSINEKIQKMIEAGINVHEWNGQLLFTSDIVEKKVLNLFKETYENALTGISTELYQKVEQTTAKAI